MINNHEPPSEELVSVIDSVLKNRESLPAEDIEQLEKIRAIVEDVKSHRNNRLENKKAFDVAIRLVKVLLDSDLIGRIFDP